MSKEYEHALKVFDALENEARVQETSAGIKMLVYKGKVTYLFSSLGISQSYYSAIFRKLKSLGCITQLQKGGSFLGTEYVLHFPPDQAKYDELAQKPLTRPVDVAILSQEFQSLREKIGGVDIGELVEQVRDLEERVQRVEGKVSNAKSKNTNRKEA